MVNNIRNNAISEIDAKKRLNTLNIIKNSEIKHKRLIPGQKELLNLFNDLSDIILTDKTLMSSKDEKLKEEKEDEKLKEEKEDEKLQEEKEDENNNENEDDDNVIKNIKTFKWVWWKNKSKQKKNKIIRKVNDHLDEIIDKSKSFEEQIKSLKKGKDPEGFYPYNDFGDKELKSKYFKIELAKLSNDVDEKLFEEIFGHTLISLQMN